jgi:hypothetical protein
MKRMMTFTVLLGFMVMVTLSLEGSSHRAGNLPDTLAGLLSGPPPNFSSAGQLWDPNGDLLLSSEFHRFEGPDAIAGALHAKYSGWHVELAGPSHTWPAESAEEAALFEPKVLAIQKPPAPKPAKPKRATPKTPPSTMAFAPGINRPDLEFVNWVYRVQQGNTVEIHLYTAIAQRRHVNPGTAPSDHEHNQQWRFLTVRELPAPPPVP